MEKLGAGVIGLRMGASHVVAYARHPNVEVRAVCDLDPEIASKVAQAHGIQVWTTDDREIIHRDDLHLISVCSPDPVHREHTVAALNAGKHVLCEKPMALSLDDCRAMIEAADRSNRRLMVGQVCRYAPGFRTAKQIVHSGRIGELFFVESEYAHNYASVPGIGGWRKDPGIGREPVVGGGIHAVDLLRWVAGECIEVSAYSNHKALTDWPKHDCTIATMKFENSVIGKVLVSIGCVRPYTMRSVFYGTQGTVICDNTTPHMLLYTNEFPHSKDFTTIPVSLSSHNVGAEINELVDAVLHNRPVPTDGREGARSVATCLAIVESAGKGKAIPVEHGF